MIKLYIFTPIAAIFTFAHTFGLFRAVTCNFSFLHPQLLLWVQKPMADKENYPKDAKTSKYFQSLQTYG